MRSSHSNVNLPDLEAMVRSSTWQSRKYVLTHLLKDIVKLETASPLPSVRRRRIKHDEDAEPSTSNNHRVGQLPEGCLGAWALYFLPGIIKLQGARLEVWNPNNVSTVSDLQKLWDFNYGQSVKHNIIVGNPVFRGVRYHHFPFPSN